MSVTKWLPLESNPEVMNKFLYSIGVPNKWTVVDIYGLDDELLAMVPKPVLAVMLLFPIGDKSEAYSKEQEKNIKTSGQTVSDNVYFMEQKIRNACGTVALLHAVANNVSTMLPDPTSAIGKFLADTKNMTPEQRGKKLEEEEDIGAAHEESAQEGQTLPPDLDAVVPLHFIALVHVDGHLYELDGRKAFPINHGTTTPDNLLLDSVRVCKGFMERDPENMNFTLMAVSGQSNE